MLKSKNQVDCVTTLENTDVSVKTSVFKAFSVEHFIPWKSWKRLEPILKSNGGAFGIAGPRGSGKSWLILRGVKWAIEKEGVGLWFPTPSDYGAEPFLMAIADNFAKEVQRSFPSGAPKWYEKFTSSISLILGIVMFALFFILSRPNPYSLFGLLGFSHNYELTFPFNIFPYIGFVFLIGAIVLLCCAFLSKRSVYRIDKYLYTKAIQLRQKLRYVETKRKSSESSGKLGKDTFAGFSMKNERNLTERTPTIASLVYELRGFMQEVAERSNHPIVIGIDELDKIHNAEEARKLLREVKGIFEVEGVHFLVSVSDEARRNLELGSLRIKDEFNSSFYTVIEMEPKIPSECAKLLNARSPDVFSENAALALGILSAGNLRELVRLADLVVHEEGGFKAGTLISEKNVASKVSLFEALAFRQDIVQSQLEDEIKVWVYNKLGEWKFDGTGLKPTTSKETTYLGQFSQYWNLPIELSESQLWKEEYAEAWHRLIIRTVISMEIAAGIEDLSKYANSCQGIIVTASHSAEIAKLSYTKQVGNPLQRNTPHIKY